jgi:hypothetical protein
MGNSQRFMGLYGDCAARQKTADLQGFRRTKHNRPHPFAFLAMQKVEGSSPLHSNLQLGSAGPGT